ncbi:hypothetical protein Tco_0817103 [Tanacetum coccineum]
MLLEGSKLTKEDQESQLYDDFEHFRQNKGETIHDYYVRFAKLINDMRNIKMTMSDSSLNLKFINNMLPEWGRFVTVVKLNRGLRDSNYDQLYAYLKQHEAHTNENKMMLDRFTQHTVDPLALMSNVSHQQYYSQSSTTLPSIYVLPHFVDNTQLDSGLSPTDNLIKNLTNTLALLTQSYKTYLPQTNNQLRTSLNTRNQATVQDGRVVVQNVKQDKMMLMQAQENGVALDEEQLLFIAGGQDNAVDEDVNEQPVQDLALSVDNVFQADDYILSEVHNNDHYQDAVCDHHENNVVDKSLTVELVTYKEQIELYERRAKFELTEREQKIDEQLRIGRDEYNKQDSLFKTVHMWCKPSPIMIDKKVAIGYKNPLCLTRAKQVQLALYNGHEIIKTNHVPAIVHNLEDTLKIAEITRKKMNDKIKEPRVGVKNKDKIAPHD